MRTVFDQTNQLRFECFEKHLLQQTNNLREVLAAATRTQSSHLESTHFLMALIRIPGGLTQEFFSEEGIAPTQLEKGLIGCVEGNSSATPPNRLTPEVLEDSAKKVINTLDGYLKTGRLIDEGQLFLSTLKHLTPKVVDILDTIQLTPRNLITKLNKKLEDIDRYEVPDPFDNKSIRLDVFSLGGQHVLSLMKSEAEALGYSQIDPRHLLLALVEYEGGATQVVLYQQDILPKKIQERVTINLRGHASKNRSQLDLHKNFMNSSVIQILNQAAIETKADLSNQIAEVHILRAFLNSETFALRQLSDAGLGLSAAKEAAQQFKPTDEIAPTISSDMKSWEKIKADLETALVGQQDVVDMCLPFIRRMLFGFRNPNKPIGVLLFCGPSGSGKTEMAKTTARAVFGSEENLIMLEMGQFQTRESMNIFIGAPPGYIGYGEGKLTNGLRDKPRSVVLFDEIEKAHPQVFDALLRFVDEGKIDDPAGPIRDGSQCVIIMTSNVRTEQLDELTQKGDYRKNKWEIRRRLRKALLGLTVETKTDSSIRRWFEFKPEFLNRIDEIILFRKLNETDLTAIAHRHLNEYIQRLQEEKQVKLTYSPNIAAAARLIGHFCATLDEGARVIPRVTQAAVLDPIIEFYYKNIYNQNHPLPIGVVVHFPWDSEEVVEPYGIVNFLNE
jgi:ATP-dependent Clp protease ATP-binding subunit ClpA